MRTKRLLLPFVATAAATAFALGACNDGGVDPLSDSDERGRLTIQLTDAPGDLEDAFIKIKSFILIQSDNPGQGERIEITPSISGFIELLGLTGGKVLTVVNQAIVPVGTYSEIRVVLDEAFIRLKDGRVFATPDVALPTGITAVGELKCPSCSQSGFKVKFGPGGLVVDNNSIIVIDFSAAQSFGHEAGKSGKWIMHPVLRGTATNIPFGRITGNVTLATNVTIPTCGGQANTFAAFKPTAATATDTLVGVTDAAGLYQITSVPPATYTLGHVADITFTNGDSLTFAAAATPASVTVQPGDSAKANYVISAATCH
jgi:hypothetical protein